jgi:hypothetical protein
VCAQMIRAWNFHSEKFDRHHVRNPQTFDFLFIIVIFSPPNISAFMMIHQTKRTWTLIGLWPEKKVKKKSDH